MFDTEYLRGLSDYADKQMCEAFCAAADEIERLREEVERYRGASRNPEDVRRLTEAERLLRVVVNQNCSVNRAGLYEAINTFLKND